MLPFSESVFLQKAKVMYKVSKNIAPEYLTDLFNMRDSNSNSTFLRSVNNKHFLIPKPKNLFKNSLSYSCAYAWNSIPLDIKKYIDSKFLCSQLYILIKNDIMI